MRLIGKYVNGNYMVSIYDDGTKVRENNLDNLTPSFAENMDVCLTKRCAQECQYCYEGCTRDGKHSDILSQKWLYTLHPYTELALNGNDLDHPQLYTLLEKLKGMKVITNITVNQNQFMQHLDMLHDMQKKDLIHGLGISLKDPTVEFITAVKEFPNAVIHIINGIVSMYQLDRLSSEHLKILILGYKNRGRGKDYLTNSELTVRINQELLKSRLHHYIKFFDVVSFDNLAIKQLNVQNLVPKDKWSEFYMGDDGNYTFYIDAVDGVFAKNSLSDNRHPLLDSVDEMFDLIRKLDKAKAFYTKEI